MAFAANRGMRLLMAAAVQDEHPDWGEAQVRKEVARRILAAADD